MKFTAISNTKIHAPRGFEAEDPLKFCYQMLSSSNEEFLLRLPIINLRSKLRRKYACQVYVSLMEGPAN